MNTAAISYGSDLSGLICSYPFRPGDMGQAISSAEAEAWVRNETPPEGEFIWLHFNLANASSERWLQRHLKLSPLFYEALHEGTRSTRIDYADDTLIGVVNDVTFDFSFDASDIATLWLSVDPRIVVSARSKPLRSVDRLRAAVKNGEPLRSPVGMLVHLLRDEADVLIEIVRKIAAEVDTIEDRLLAGRPDRNRSQLSALRRFLIRLQRLLAPEPSALFRLLNRPPAWVADHDVRDLRQSTEEFSTVLSDISALQERIKLLQEEIAAHTNEQTNRSLFVLTVVTVLALPINIITGFFGMNVGGIPLAQDGSGFWVVVSLVAIITLIAASFAFRNKD